MSKSQEYTACFVDLGHGSIIRDRDIEASLMGNFVCAMYGKPKLIHVNEAQYATFQLSFAPRNDREPLQKKSKESMPACFPLVIQLCTGK